MHVYSSPKLVGDAKRKMIVGRQKDGESKTKNCDKVTNRLI